MDSTSTTLGVTESLATWIAGERDDPPTERALICAKHAVLDWLGVALAGSRDPLVDYLIADATDHQESGSAPIIGHPVTLSPAFAALVNGSASHALDYDDVNTRMRGHPTVAVLPAILATASGRAVSGRALLDALVVGTETACIVGEMLGDTHYERGFHTTATVGTVAATAGVSRLLGLSTSQCQTALGLAATQAAGLRAMFGTMAKPLHAGKAAMNGLLAARWARAGITAGTDVIEAQAGLGAVLSDPFKELIVRQDIEQPFGIERNVFKYHAACYYAHSAIEALRLLIEERNLEPTDIDTVTVSLQETLLGVCDIVAPDTGLEIKFSVRHLLAMVLSGMNTSNVEVYTVAVAHDPNLIELRQRITATPEAHASRMTARVTVRLADGETLERVADVSNPNDDLALQRSQLVEKFDRLASPVVGSERASEIVYLVERLDTADCLDSLFNAATTT